MRTAALFLAGMLAAIVGGLALALPAHALSPLDPKTERANYVAPAPPSPKTPVLFPDAGPMVVAAGTSLCAYLGTGKCVRLDCETSNCAYRQVTMYPDAGMPQVFPDAGVASPSDTPLPADTPEAFCLVGAEDSLCAYFPAAGTLAPSVRN